MTHSSRTHLKCVMPHAPWCEAKQRSFQTYTKHFQGENLSKLAMLNMSFYPRKAELATHTPRPHQVLKEGTNEV